VLVPVLKVWAKPSRRLPLALPPFRALRQTRDRVRLEERVLSIEYAASPMEYSMSSY
jgi:hypothetical protein